MHLEKKIRRISDVKKIVGCPSESDSDSDSVTSLLICDYNVQICKFYTAMFVM
jgi:hypothetical protein